MAFMEGWNGRTSSSAPSTTRGCNPNASKMVLLDAVFAAPSSESENLRATRNKVTIVGIDWVHRIDQPNRQDRPS